MSKGRWTGISIKKLFRSVKTTLGNVNGKVDGPCEKGVYTVEPSEGVKKVQRRVYSGVVSLERIVCVRVCVC